MAQIMTPYSCSNCAALNSKLHRSKTENGECRVRIDELSSEVAAHSDRVRELEDALRSLRDELAARGKMVQAAKAAESAARDELAYERQKQSAPNSAVAAAALREAELESLVHAAQRSEQTMRSRMEAAEFEARRAVQERKLLNDSVAAAEAEMAREREWARERDANSDQVAAAERAARERAAAAEAACCAAVAEARAEGHAATQAAEQMPKETAATMRELLSAVKIAVLAPCLKLHINGAEPLSIGSAGQVDFSSLSSMLEENVLKRFSQVTLLDSETPLATGAGGAHAIFPELRETMASVQEEVRERLVAMMQNAGE